MPELNLEKRVYRILVASIFIITTLISSISFMRLNHNRNVIANDHNKKSFKTILSLTNNMISTGYFQWDDMYYYFLEDDMILINKMFDEIRDVSDFVLEITTIDTIILSLEQLYTINNIDGRIFVDFTIYDNNMERFIRDRVVRVEIDIDTILKEIQAKNDFRFCNSNKSYPFVYKLRVTNDNPRIFFFQIISSISVGLLVSLLILRVFYTHSHFFYETRGLEKIIFLFEQKEKYSADHSIHVANITYFLGKKMGFKRKKLKDLKVAALLHDIGKISVPMEILNKTDALTDDEYDIIKQHPIFSDNILKNFEELSHLRPYIRHHHEKMDGTGYPDGLKGEEIPIESRIIAIADIFEALIGERPYRKPLTHDEAILFMEQMSIDKNILKILHDNLSDVSRILQPQN